MKIILTSVTDVIFLLSTYNVFICKLKAKRYGKKIKWRNDGNSDESDETLFKTSLNKWRNDGNSDESDESDGFFYTL